MARNKRKKNKQNRTKGGKGRRNKGSRATQRGPSFSPKLERLVAERRKDRLNEDRLHEERKKKLEEKGKEQEERESKQIPSREVYVTNVKFNATAKQLKDFLENLYGQVDDVRLFEDPNYPGQTRGQGIVTFHSPRSAENAIEDYSYNKEFFGRTIKIRTNNPKKGKRRPSTRLTLPLLSFEVGDIKRQPSSTKVGRMTARGGKGGASTTNHDAWLSAWNVKKGRFNGAGAKEFAVDGTTRRLYCTFNTEEEPDTTYEVQIYMKEIVGYIPIQYEADGQVSLFIHLWRCPKIFKKVKQNLATTLSLTEQQNNTMGHFFRNHSMLKVVIDDEVFGDSLSYSREPKVEKVRTTDPTTDVFGSFFTYRIIVPFRHEHFHKIKTLLSHYSLTEGDPVRVRRSPNLVTWEDRLWRPNASYGARIHRIPFGVRYELEVLAATGRINVKDFNSDFLTAIENCISKEGEALAVAILRQMSETIDAKKDDIDDLVTMFHAWEPDIRKISKHAKYLAAMESTISANNENKTYDQQNSFSTTTYGITDSVSADDACYVLRVAVTPLRIVVLPQECETKNRILRSMPRDKILRLQFTDENLSLLDYSSLSNDVQERIRYVLDHGVVVGGRQFDFLAFSASQLKEHSCWMISRDMNAEAVRRRMGDFKHINVPGKYAARMGQCFSTTHVGTKEALSSEEWLRIYDVTRNCYKFSDGVGTISTSLLEEIATHRHLKSTPSAIQVRIGGVKGVLCHDPTLGEEGDRFICTRPSQEKFDAPNTTMDLEVCTESKFLPCFLNRQLITLLSTLGVPDDAFIKLQDQMLRDFRVAQNDMDVALRMLRQSNSIELAQHMIEAGMTATDEPFLRMLLKSFKSQRLQEMQMKTRLLVPGGCLLMGVMDETNTLKYGQVFVQIQRKHEPVPQIVRRKVIVCKNPCLHPGDVLHLKAVDAPQLRHLVNVIVFPQQGHRPHPNETAGSDLDGDLFSVIWDDTLIPPERYPHMSYEAPLAESLNRDVTIEDIKDFFVKFVLNDNLGVIANAHLAFADQSPEGAYDQRCIELARLHSMAVDFPKTGVAAKVPKNLVVKSYPDFMDKKDRNNTYMSEKVIGILYRSSKHLTSYETHQTDRTIKGTGNIEDGPVDIYDHTLGGFVSSSSSLSSTKFESTQNASSGSSSSDSSDDNSFDTAEEEGDDDSDDNEGDNEDEDNDDLTSFKSTMEDDMLDDAYRGREWYNHELISIMNRFGVDKEAEAIIGYVLKFSRHYSKSKRKYDVMERLKVAVNQLKRKARQDFFLKVEKYIDPLTMDEEEMDLIKMELASAYYYVSYHPHANNDLGLLSFPWISCPEYLCNIFALHQRTATTHNNNSNRRYDNDGPPPAHLSSSTSSSSTEY